MPPTAPNQQGSRAALITALVIFVILFITSTILAFKGYTAYTAEVATHQADTKAMAPAVTPSLLANPEIANAIQEGKPKNEPAITIFMQRRDELAKVITSNPAAPNDAVNNDVKKTLMDARSALGDKVFLTEDNLLADIKSLTAKVSSLSEEVTTAQAAAKKASDVNKVEEEKLAAALAERDKKIVEANDQVTKAQKEKDDREAKINADLAGVKTDADKKITDAATQLAAVQGELGKVQQELKKALADYDKLKVVLARYRINPSRSLLQPAGVITRVPGNNTVFISLGLGQQISPGLTFEVYDRKKGLPSLTAPNPENPDELPAGKASIEVIRIMQDTSECRIIKQVPGTQIVEGDLILNLIFNTHTRFAFMVYGDFDIAGVGQATPGDAELIKRLINQWGGRLMDTVNVDTDFIVLGKEPVVHPLPDSPTPLDQGRHDKEQEAYDKYQNMRDLAIHLSVPILNQNRFLYFVGYYDQARR